MYKAEAQRSKDVEIQRTVELLQYSIQQFSFPFQKEFG